MAKRERSLVISVERIEQSILLVRGHRVMLDSDLAKLYGVPTKALNQAVRRNRDRFPEDFAFQLDPTEAAPLRSQIVTSNASRGGRRYTPWVFTEHGGAILLAGVLRSPRAVQVNVEIMRAFVRLRRLLATPGELVEQITNLANTVHLHDRQIKVITDVLSKLTESPAKPQRRIGF